MTRLELLARLSVLRSTTDLAELHGKLEALSGDVADEKLHDERTLTLENTSLSICDVRAWTVVQPPHLAWPQYKGPLTHVWLRGVGNHFTLQGDHHAAIRAAVEGAA